MGNIQNDYLQVKYASRNKINLGKETILQENTRHNILKEENIDKGGNILNGNIFG